MQNTFYVQQLRSLSTFGIPLFFQDAVLLCVWPHQLINSTDTCLCLLFFVVAVLQDMSLELTLDVAQIDVMSPWEYIDFCKLNIISRTRAMLKRLNCVFNYMSKSVKWCVK